MFHTKKSHYGYLDYPLPKRFFLLLENEHPTALLSESPNPFWGLHAAVTRQRTDGSPGQQGWYPEQRLNLEQALHGFTTGAAYAAGWEDRLGRLAPGYLADLIVLERDPFECAPQELHTLKPSGTMVVGEWMYQE